MLSDVLECLSQGPWIRPPRDSHLPGEMNSRVGDHFVALCDGRKYTAAFSGLVCLPCLYSRHQSVCPSSDLERPSV